MSETTNSSNSTFDSSKAVALTTWDNPYNPIDDFESWFSFEVEQGYNTSGLLARVARTSPMLSDEENNDEVNRAIDEILKNDPICLYRKIKEGEKPDPKQITIYKQTMKQFETA